MLGLLTTMAFCFPVILTTSAAERFAAKLWSLAVVIQGPLPVFVATVRVRVAVTMVSSLATYLNQMGDGGGKPSSGGSCAC